MKYRIKIKEYKNGSIDYIVQKQKVKPIILYISTVVFPLIVLLVLNLDSDSTVRAIGLFLSIILLLFFLYMITQNYYDVEASSSMDSAKRFIDKQIAREVKSTTYLKHP